MWKKAKRFLAVLLALTLMLSVVDSEELFVSASATNVQEDTGAGGETEPAAGEETKSTDVSVEEDTAVTSVGDEGSGEDTATVPGDGTGTGTETGGAADETGTDGTETAGTGTETSGSGTEGAEGTTVPGSETPANGTEGTEGAAGTGENGTPGETAANDGTAEVTGGETEGTAAAPGTAADENGSEETGITTESGTKGTENETNVADEGDGPDSKAEDEAEEQPVRYTAQANQDDKQVNVIVDVPAGAFDTDMEPKLHASLLTGQDEVDKAAAEVAEQTGAEFDGMLVLDVYFTDGDTDTEMEPAVPVSVRFELPEGVLPENMDPSTLTVHHLAEMDDDGGTAVQVETVATSAADDGVDGIVALSADAAETAETSGEVNLIDDLPDMENETEDSIEDPAVVAEFEVESFSRFTISYGNQNGIQVYLVNESGQELWNGVISFDDLDDMFDPTDFKDKFIENQWISIEELAGTWASKTEGYLYQRAYRTYWGSERQEDITWIRYNTENTGSIWNNQGWRYSANADAPNGASGDGALASLYLVYEPVTEVAENPDLKIENTVSEDGSLKAVYNKTDSNLYYVWEKSADGQEWAPITRLKMNGDQYNLTEDGQVLNAALEVVNDENDEGGQWFRVAVYENEEAYGKEEDALAVSAPMQLEYYDTLRNGDFETPSVSDLGTSKGNYQYPNGTDGLIWQTTGSDRQIEIVDVNSEASRDNYHTSNDAQGQEGHQFAELNAEAAGALYQDVLTVPGTPLNWQFYHRGRGSSAQDNNKDTMYLLIAPAHEVENITTQDQLNELINKIQRDAPGYGKADGYYLYTASDNNRQWNYYSSNSPGAEAYEVPEDQYLTRFFFVAGETAANQTSNGWTIGNLLDDVLFTTELLPAQPGTANLTVKKVVTGIREEDMEDYTVYIELYGKETSQNVTLGSEGHPFIPRSDGSYVAEWDISGITVDPNGSADITVRENPVAVLGYEEAGSTVSVNDEAAQSGIQGTITLSEQDSGKVEFTNSYSKDTPPEVDPSDVSVTTGKRADLNDAGNYDLTLSVTGERASVGGEDMLLDVLFILDSSGSMDDPWGKNSDSRMNAATDAIRQIVDGLDDTDGLDTQYSLVTFSDDPGELKWWGLIPYYEDEPYNDADIISSWVDGTALKDNLPGDYDGDDGTNYEAGFRTGNEVLQSGRDNAQTVVIFLSDGDPTFYYDTEGYTQGNGEEFEQDGLNHAAALCETLNADYFYTVGIASGVRLERMQDLIDAADHIPSSNRHAYSAGETSDLLNIFRQIEQQITFFAAENVVMYDTLSKWADVVDPAVVEFTVRLEEQNADGEWYTPEENIKTTVSGENVSFTTITTNEEGEQESDTVYIIPTYNAGTKFIEVKLSGNAGGTETYALAPGYRYSVSLEIKPSADAVSKGMESEEANQTPDPDTGTHADNSATPEDEMQKGFWSNVNDDAYVEYSVGETSGITKPFPKPVIQVPEPTTGNLTIDKVISGLPEDTSFEGQEYRFEITGIVDGQPVTGSFNDETIVFDNGKATVTVTADGEITINNLPEGNYTVKEITEGLSDIGDYHFSNVSYGEHESEASAIVSVSAGSTATVRVTNVYEHNDQTLTVRKFITGNMSHEKDEFDFTLTLTDNGQLYTGGISSDKLEQVVDEHDQPIAGKYSFTLTAEEGENTLVIELPYGVEATVEETDSEYTESSRSFRSSLLEETSDGEAMSLLPSFVEGDREVEVTMTDDWTVDFQNKLEIVDPPTGLNHDSTPYTLMVTIASFVGLALIGSLFVYRRRHRM